MSDFPEPLVTGTITFVVLTIIAMIFGGVSRYTGILSKENSKVFVLLALITGICLWLFWACAWLHQWHLLIMPVYNKD